MIESCQFCNLYQDQKENSVIFENEQLLAFLDIRPVFKGHSLLIPKTHYETFYDLPNSMISEIFLNAKKLGRAIEKAMKAEGSFIAMNNVVSQSIPHFHMHIIPRKTGDGLKGFFWPRIKYVDKEEILQIQSEIIACLKDENVN